MSVMQKREVTEFKKTGLGVNDILLTGVLLAAGAVLKFTVGTVINFGMKPNFIIAMYCLIVLLIKPRIGEAAIIGLLAGAVCQFFPGQPYINFISELIGAVAMCLLIKIPMSVSIKNGKVSAAAVVATFFSTLASGFSFIGVMYIAFFAGADIEPTSLAAFMAIIFGTALINSIIVQVLYVPLKLALKK